jgi:putative nucleotidyltransferase with HDIG domain
MGPSHFRRKGPMPKSATAAPDVQSLRLAEIVSALSYALDLTDGQPLGHSLRCTWIGMHIGRAIGLGQDQLSDLFYTLLLKDLGCSSNAARICQLFVTSDFEFKRSAKLVDTHSLAQVLRFVVSNTAVKSGLADRLRGLLTVAMTGGQIDREIIETRCERGAQIARQMRFSEAVAQGILDLDEHWNGGGHPLGKKQTEISILARIALLAQVVDVFTVAPGPRSAVNEVRRRAGTWFDPSLVAAFEEIAAQPEFWSAMRGEDLSAQVFALEPQHLVRSVDDDYLDDIADGFAQVVDAKSPFTSGHSKRVALVTELIAEELGVPAERKRWLVRAALLHDLGKLGVSNEILDKPGKLDDAEWAAVRGHPEAGAATLRRMGAFATMAKIALEHHERLDGKGYPRGLRGDEIDLETRIVTVADIFDALTADRPYRKAMTTADALNLMRAQVGAAIDGKVFAALETTIQRLQRVAA